MDDIGGGAVLLVLNIIFCESLGLQCDEHSMMVLWDVLRCSLAEGISVL
jgi:hypothetical protein